MTVLVCIAIAVSQLVCYAIGYVEGREHARAMHRLAQSKQDKAS